MKVLGIVSEYNPLHNGHKYHINKSKELSDCDYTVSIMSGNFVQRGEPAILDKWTRAKTAVENGVDLVIELPVIYSLATAELFAKGAIKTLASTGIITHLSFGCEYDNINTLKKVAKILIDEPSEFSSSLKENLAAGYSYAFSRKKSLENYLKEDLSFMENSNNILAIEYLKCLEKIGSDIMPVPVKRIVSNYNDRDIYDNFSSASSIRNYILKNSADDKIYKNIPESTFNSIINNINNLKTADNYFNQIKTVIYRMCPSDLTVYPDVSEGLENRIFKAVKNSDTFENAVNEIYSKRYAKTRIQRILFNILLDIKREHQAMEPEYIRILAFNDKGKELIKAAKANCSLKIIQKPGEIDFKNKKAMDILTCEIRATNIYNIDKPDLDYLTSPIIV